MSIINRRRRDVCVFLPNKDQLDITVGVRARGHDIFSRVSDLLDVKEVHLFGLTILRDDEHVFLDLEQKLTKYFGNKWRRNSRKDPLHLFLKVQFFIDPSQLILYNRAQQIYYADMRQRVLSSQCFHQEALFFQLAAYALQADLGDLSPEQEGDTSKGKKVGHYFLPQDYFPPWWSLNQASKR
ncbi:hypothetical protein UPYG_G00297210 [Umbra pygmaea]|uniref:FERM domain-containing protein n=1 Tax=Umbra pygmaea TaxID=75934 RepID=A0ABD0W6R5_UMBPY